MGYLIGSTGYRPIVDTLVNKLILTHDSKGNYTKFEYFNNKKQKTGYHVCTLDEKGNYIEAKYFNKSDSLTFTLTTIYDLNGNIIKQKTFNERTKSTGVWDYKDLKLDGHGNWIETYSNIDNGKYKIFAERSYIYY
jgi:phage-related protein